MGRTFDNGARHSSSSIRSPIRIGSASPSVVYTQETRTVSPPCTSRGFFVHEEPLPVEIPVIETRSAGKGYASLGGGDNGTAYVERAEIYDAVRDGGITGFVTVSGDRHSFWRSSRSIGRGDRT